MKATLYGYVKTTNKRFIEKEGLKYCRSMSYVMDKLIDCARLKKPFVLTPKVLKSIEKAEKIKARTKKKLRSLNVSR